MPTKNIEHYCICGSKRDPEQKRCKACAKLLRQAAKATKQYKQRIAKNRYKMADEIENKLTNISKSRGKAQ